MAIVHKIEFTPAGGSLVTLADLASANPYQLIRWPSAAQKEIAAMYKAANPLILPLGNVAGECVFIAWKSYDTAANAAADFKTKRALVNSQGTLVVTYSGTALTMAGALLSAFEPVQEIGVRWVFQYTFDITTIT